MGKIDPNAPAFPGSSLQNDERNAGWIGGGLTIRAHLAAMAMGGIAASETLMNNLFEQVADDGSCDIGIAVAQMAVEFSDALIAELNK